MVAALARISLVLCSGTLPSRATSRTEFVRYAPWKSGRDRMTGNELLDEMPELHSIAGIEVDSGNPHEVATPVNLRDFALHIGESLRSPEIDGVVIVQGTNSLEETAFFLELTVNTDKPVIITGAQRPFTALSTDGPVNLLDAMRVAVSPEARGKGVLVVANNEIHSGRDVSKTNTYRLQTFASRDLGPLGFADPDRIVFYRAPLRRHTAAAAFRLDGNLGIPRVDVLYVHAGANGDLAHAAAELGARGLVIAGTGAGATGDMRSTLASLQRERGIAVVRSSRVGGGRVLLDDNWQEPSMIAADNLNPQKAAILLALALTRTVDPVEIQNIFDTY